MTPAQLQGQDTLNNYYDGWTSVKINHLGGCGYRV